MTTKEYLRQIQTVDTEIKYKLDEIEHLKSLRERTTTVMTGMPRGGNGEDRLNTITCRIWELEAEIDKEVDKLVDMKTEARKRIEAISDNRYRTILSGRYLCCKSLLRVSNDMGYDYDWARVLHGRALIAYERTHTDTQTPVV